MRTRILCLLLMLSLAAAVGQKNGKGSVLENIGDIKEFKKVLRTRTNVLILFVNDKRESSSTIKVFTDAAQLLRGHGTLALCECSNSGESKKLCKKLKVNPEPHLLKHYKDGDFHKDYDRKVAIASLVNFVKDPTGDLPWEEDPSGADVLHFLDPASLDKFLKKETKPSLIMFYAPWCGYCKKMKPDYAAAAAELKPDYIIAAIDVNKPENAIVRKSYNITGFPTLIYFENGQMKFTYEGEKGKQNLIDFMKNPTAQPAEKETEPDWAENASDIVHLTAASFEPVLKEEKAALVMFYAPWCGHCKKMKPVYEKAAEAMKSENIPGMLAALDATKEPAIGSQFGVKGYPTFKFFEHGEFKYNVNHRDLEGIVKFMRNPEEPPPPPPPEKDWEDEPSEVQHLNADNFKPFLKKKKNVLLMFYAPWCGHCKRAKPEFVEAAEVFKDDPKVELAAVDCTKHSAICGSQNVKGYPTIKYFSYLKTVKEYNDGRLAADFIKYLKKKSENGDVDTDLEEENKPEEVPFGEYPGSEFIVQGSDENFDETLKKHKKVLAFFYASWCGHCKVMKPILSEVAQDLDAENDEAKIVAIDASIHSKTGSKYEIKGYPTIKLFINGINTRNYNSPRTKEALYNFIKTNGNPKTEL